VRAGGRDVAAIILCNPHNPLGRCYPLDIIGGYAKLCQDYGIHLIVDEIYALSVYDNPDLLGAEEFHSVLELDLNALRIDTGRVHVAYGISKDFGANGFRIGVVVSQNPRVRKAFYYTYFYDMVSTPPDILWSKVLTDRRYLDHFFYDNRRLLGEAYQYVTRWATFHGLDFYAANAGLFVMVSFRSVIEDPSKHGEKFDIMKEKAPITVARTFRDEDEFVAALLAAKVTVSLGRGFLFPEKGWLRVIFSLERDVTRVGLRRIEQVIGWPSWPGLNERSANEE